MNKKIILSAVTIMAALIAEAQAIPWEIEEDHGGSLGIIVTHLPSIILFYEYYGPENEFR